MELLTQINTTALAYLGDSVYEVFVRRKLVEDGVVKVDVAHRKATKYVSAKGQCKGMNAIISSEILTEPETAIVRRAKNRKIHSKPKNVSPMVYKEATAFEALVGFLYLSGENKRLEEIVALAMDSIEQFGKEGCNE